MPLDIATLPEPLRLKQLSDLTFEAPATSYLGERLVIYGGALLAQSIAAVGFVAEDENVGVKFRTLDVRRRHLIERAAVGIVIIVVVMIAAPRDWWIHLVSGWASFQVLLGYVLLHREAASVVGDPAEQASTQIATSVFSGR